jgi:hypothetical protein
MVHHRVADQHRLDDQRRVDPALGRDLGRQPVQRLAHHAGHLGIAAGVHHHIADPAHQVLAEPDLGIHHPGRGQHPPIGQVAQMRRDGGGAQVDGQPVDAALVEPRPDLQDARARVAVAAMHRHRHLPAALAQRRLQPAQHRQPGLGRLQPPLVGQRTGQPLQIAGRLVHVGLFHLDVVKLRRRVHRDDAGGRCLADHLLVDLAFGRHVDHHVAHDLRLTAQPPTSDQPALFAVAFLDRVPARQRIGRHRHPVLGELAHPRRDLAARADAAPAADAVQIDPQLPRGGQHRRAGRKPPALAGWREDHKGVGGFAIVAPFGARPVVCRWGGDASA